MVKRGKLRFAFVQYVERIEPPDMVEENFRLHVQEVVYL